MSPAASSRGPRPQRPWPTDSSSGGCTLGGGFGRLPALRAALDNVRGVEIVTAKGEILRADARENSELYWGVRGGGGNFGVVTGFDFDLHPCSARSSAARSCFPMSALQVLSIYAEYEGTAPDELYLSCALASNSRFSGVSGVAFIVCYSGPPGDADRILRTLRSAGKPMLDTVKPIDYVALQRSGDGDEKRAIGSYTKTGFVKKIPPTLIDAMVSGLEEHPQRSTVVGFQHCGAAIARVAADATAFPHRGIHATSLLTVDWPGDAYPAPHIKWLLDYWARIVPHTDGFYTNDATEETQKQLDENYLGNLPRLVKQNQHDPTNLFHLNANVRPTA
jgi:hypothetical protein